MDFTSGWNSLIGFAPAGLWNVLAVFGVIIIVAALANWFWKRRKGGGGGGGGGGAFPWMAIGLGALLAGPKLVIPALLLIAQALVALAIKVLTWGGQQLQ
ncbi:hypothetical protein EDF62_1612 [Leucobacter luti]|uniref:Uncharacterized protein n=1 Tax=Leucobacter luti TaxID=340320 RepID=A0A4R6S1A2_9MICO|nr:hypothetical protein [Leucobacter luti]TDP92405.1 hypothetical protein EDF62_1612 [Leucobacter luti]